ncbi:M17 family metallopeptidase [Mycoplasma sp. 1018B]|uniref:M17 family metallopeptidase n=1 Tax=Mycoplasma sp. 1018B TaxID=2967302 RepID=UPI00211BD072|nr:M17 family metallopeptidase [Mycoplasma sp. 1018B]UUM19385.1 M17 family metallopeptidase [Mycoplasma sp. 1018B]
MLNNIYLTKQKEKTILLKAQYENDSINNSLINLKNGSITEFLDQNLAYIYISKDNQDLDSLNELIKTTLNAAKREYQFDLYSFLNKNITIEQLLKIFTKEIIFYSAQLFNKKKNNTPKKEFSILMQDDNYLNLFNKFALVANNRNLIRNLQIMPENYCNSEQLANFIVEDFSGINNLKINVLGKKELETLNMNLILSVNKGSTHEPRVVIIEYTGDKDSKEKTVLVGKGITFDTGGVNTKGYHMEGMKYDMSGSVIVAYVVKTLAQLKVKKNVSAIMMITDNRLALDASLPENIYQSMAQISVEVSDTDAEGRLVLADGLYYGAEKLNATTLIDVATLTGTMTVALGNVYSGIYATEDNLWEKMKQAAENNLEKIWRMPFHEDFHEGNKSSLVADLMNYSNTVKSDANAAAMFLKEFTKDIPFIHCDIAGTADINGKPQGVLIDTLVDFVINN